MTNWLLIKKQLRKIIIEGAFNLSIVNFGLNKLVVVIKQFISISDFKKTLRIIKKKLGGEFYLVLNCFVRHLKYT